MKCGTSKAVKLPFSGILEIPAINPMVLRCFKTWAWRTWHWVYVCLCLATLNGLLNPLTTSTCELFGAHSHP